MFTPTATSNLNNSYDDIAWLFTQNNWKESDEACLLAPYTYLTSLSGKEIRKQMIAAFNLWLEVPPNDLAVIGHIVSMLHNASLLVDDVEDNSQLRRGSPVAHKIYGVPQVINTANYVYFQAFGHLSSLRGSATDLARYHNIVIEELLNLHRGQGLDLYWRDTLSCPTEQEYIEMVNNKTGGLFRLAVRLMMAVATKNVDIDYTGIVNLIGVYFQIRDDLCNLQSDKYSAHKGYAEDLTEGKFSFPVIHGIRANPGDRQLLNILQQRPSSPTLKDHAVSYLDKQTRSFQYCRSVLQNLEQQVREEIRRLGGNSALEKIVDLLSNYN